MAENPFRQGGRFIVPILLLLATSFVQFHQLARDLRFLPDEAFFMSFARGAAVNGDWLLPGPLDKPPLSIYLSALSMVAVGISADADDVLHLDPRLGEFAGSLPNVCLAILLTALMMRLAWRIHRDRLAALFAGLLSATSPYLLAYGGSGLTDMSTIFCSAAALYLALAGRWGLGGLALGLAFWSKQQAALFVPLIVMILLARDGRRQDWLRLGLTLAVVCAALLIWDGARPEASIFTQAAANNVPESWLVEPWRWLGRLKAWLGRGLWLLGPLLVTGVLLVGLAFVTASRRGMGAAGNRARGVERALLLYIIGFLGAHVVLPFNHYDRYLLLILPALVVLVAGRWARTTISGAQGNGLRWGLVALIAAGGIWSLNAGTTVGGDRSAFKGIDTLADHLNAKPVATVIYDPWLGWELDYYLGQWHDKRRVHYPTAEALVDGALALDEVGDRYLVAPVDQPHDNWLAALDEAGFGVAVDYARDRFIAYRLTARRG